MLCAAMGGVASAAPSVTIDGSAVKDVVFQGNHLLIPFRAPMERIGATVDWTAPTATASMNGQQLVTITAHSPADPADATAIIKGDTTTLSVPAQLIGANAYVPVEALTDICGAKVDVNIGAQSASVTGCTLEGVNTVYQAAESRKGPGWWWLWLLILLALLLLAYFLWKRSQTLEAPSVSTPGTGTDYVTRLKGALGNADAPVRQEFVNQLWSTVQSSSAIVPESVVTAARGAYDVAAGSATPSAVSALIDKFAAYPGVLRAAVEALVGAMPGAASLLGPLAKL